MIRNPSVNSDNTPELSNEEELLFSTDNCTIEFGELSSPGTFYITTNRIIWITTSSSNPTSNTRCYSFSSQLIYLMVHALCKDITIPYLFLQIENQDCDIRIINSSYSLLQECYESLCEGQKLNPCDGDSSDAGDAFMTLDNDSKQFETEITKQQIKQQQIALEQWNNKLIIPNNNMINNNGYLEPAADGQFDDVENIMEIEQIEQKQLEVIMNNNNNNNNKPQTPSFDAFHFAEKIFDSNSKPATPSLSAGVIENMVKDIDLDNKINPYLDDEILKGGQKFDPKQNKTFEKKYKSYKNVDGMNVDKNKVEKEKINSQQ